MDKTNKIKGNKASQEDQIKTLKKERNQFEKRLTKTQKDYSKKD